VCSSDLDAVRQAQTDFEIPEAVAHRMALLAMHQTGLMMAALHPRLKPAETLSGIKRAVAVGAITVWLPFKLTAPDRLIAANWSTTSDALAARLAERLGGAPVVLVKSCRIASGTSIAALARTGVVDTAFKAIVTRARLSWRVLGAGEETELVALLDVRGRGTSRRATGEAYRRAGGQRAIARLK
jgi:5-(aminomethyl)-3-furanmethanol phosphate kinase